MTLRCQECGRDYEMRPETNFQDFCSRRCCLRWHERQSYRGSKSPRDKQVRDALHQGKETQINGIR